MPTTFQMLEQSLPRADDKRGLNDKVDNIYGYLYQLVELLRYTLENLGADNFNDTEFEEIADTISGPLYKRIEDDEGNISTLILSSELNSSRIANAEGNISILTQTAQSLSSRITDAEGNISNLTQTSKSLTSQITDVEGNVSDLSQTVGSFSSRISDTEGNISSLIQTVNGMSISVSNSESSSTITLIKDGIAISSDIISFSGFVTFSDLSTSGKTFINGDNITTGTIKADLIKPNLNGVYINFSDAVSSPGFYSKIFNLGEIAEICLGDSSTNSMIKSNYPNAIVLDGTTIFDLVPLVCDYRNGGWVFDTVLTSHNYSDFISDLNLTAKFG